MIKDRKYLNRALELARHAEGVSLPNPMVGAVIVAPDGTIIGEGYTDVYGKGHAEVQAVNAVKAEHRALLPQSTIYVTLEPCAHYGKTPPCAKLIADNNIGRCVIGTIDTFAKVSGRGVEMLRQAGVTVDFAPDDIARECRQLNRKFFTAHSQQRPFVTLKWAQSADGFMDKKRGYGEPAARISTPVSQVAVHRLRASHDAILIGSGTALADHPRLDVRLSGGKAPLPVIIDCRHRLRSILDCEAPEGECEAAKWPSRKPLIIDYPGDLSLYLNDLYHRGICSVLVEGGPTTLREFINTGLWDEARVEVGNIRFGAEGTAPAPQLGSEPYRSEKSGGNQINFYSHIVEGSN